MKVHGHTVVKSVVHAAVVGHLLATTMSQHPRTQFDRVGARDPLSVLPNWRFFAPEPAQHDFHIAYRTASPGEKETAWRSIRPQQRTVGRLFWYPERRRGKAVFDLAGELLTILQEHGRVVAAHSTSFLLLVRSIQNEVARVPPHSAPAQLQFAIVRGAGFNAQARPEPDYISSPIDLRWP